MSRPRRHATSAHTAIASPRDGEQWAMRSTNSVACDGSALALVGGDSGGDAEMERAARAEQPEEIDTDEDDAEFEERAHWGRRRASAKKSGGKAAKKRATEDDKRQPKINVFCVVQANGLKKQEPTEGNSESPVFLAEAEATATATASTEEASVLEVRVQEKEEDGNGGSSMVEVVVQTGGRPRAVPPKDTASPSSATMSPPSQEMVSALLSPTMLSGRPKRQAVLMAEHAQLQWQTTSDDPLFMTPPPGQPTKHSSATNKATLDGEPERKATSSNGLLALSSSGRKRKLEMAAGEKKKPAQQTLTVALKIPSKKKRPGVFFLTEEQKKQVVEIEAVALFKAQLREQRERDRVFFGDGDVHNPFFQSRASQKIIDVDAPEIINVLDSPQPTTATTQRKTRWKKEPLALFPLMQHVQCDASKKDDDDPPLLNVSKRILPPPEAVVIVEDDGDEEMELRPIQLELPPDLIDAQLVFADAFWLLSATCPSDAEDDIVLASLAGELSTDEVMEKVSETYGIKEKRVRKTLAALEAARTKRQDKALNLSLVGKYLPVQTAGMIGNSVPLKKLVAWLSAWKNGGNADRDRRYDDSLFAFEGDDSEEDADDGTQLYRLFILEGEVGCGKSAAVYACAEELGYEIIEINAGQLRTGKAVVDIAGEATQSTRVLHGGGPVTSDKKGKKNKAKSKKRRMDGEAAKPSHLSLVLFEDVDLIFEEDKGFLATLGSIAKHSKCPIVVTCRHRPDNFPSSPPAIAERLCRPTPREFMAWMSLVACLEGIALSRGLIARLAELFACDIRRTLQFVQTYRHRIGCQAVFCQSSLAWKPRVQPAIAASIGADADTPITIADSQDEELGPQCVPAWSRSTLRSFDLLGSNFLPLLRGSVCESVPPTASTTTAKDRDENRRHVACLDDLWGVLDTVSLGDEWEAVVADHHRTNADNGDEGADCFHADATTLRTLEMRRLSLSSFMDRRKRTPDLLRLHDCSLADGVERALQAARDGCERAKKTTRLATLKAKLDLPSIAKGSERVGARFCMDYLPLVARIVENSEPFHESRRRASRRNHYLGDVLLEMSALDDIGEAHACFPPVLAGEGDEIVPLSASSPPADTITSVSL